MGAVGIHLDEDVVAVVQTPVEPGKVSGTEAFLALAMHDENVIVCRRQTVRDLTGAVRRIVIGDENIDLRISAAGARDNSLDILRLVVGRNDDEDLVEPDLSVGGEHSSPICCLLVRAYRDDVESPTPPPHQPQRERRRPVATSPFSRPASARTPAEPAP